jgi:hypothetical protein
VVIVLQTDGEENCSTQHKLTELIALIKEKSDAGRQFVFLGAGLDAYAQARRYGIQTSKAMSYGKGERQTRAAFRGLGPVTASYALGAAGSMDFTDMQKAAAGDCWRRQAPTDNAESGPDLIGDIHI